jgi:hypothetical protein
VPLRCWRVSAAKSAGALHLRCSCVALHLHFGALRCVALRPQQENVKLQCHCVAVKLRRSASTACKSPGRLSTMSEKRLMKKKVLDMPSYEPPKKRKSGTCSICGPFSDHSSAAKHRKAVVALHATAQRLGLPCVCKCR